MRVLKHLPHPAELHLSVSVPLRQTGCAQCGERTREIGGLFLAVFKPLNQCQSCYISLCSVILPRRRFLDQHLGVHAKTSHVKSHLFPNNGLYLNSMEKDVLIKTGFNVINNAFTP